jgi:hypothetical protein
MKHLFKNPQKKGKSYICNSQMNILIKLNEIKIRNYNKLNNTSGYFFECIINAKNNKDEVKIIKEVDNDAKEYLVDYNDIYINSLDDDNYITIILSNKIETELLIDNNEVSIKELIEYINLNKKNKNFILNANVIFLGNYITDELAINKWAFKSIEIETLLDNDNDWNRFEIEEEWKYDLINYEEEVNLKISKLEKSLENAKLLYNEIINEKNLKNWEIKIDKLKNNILSIYDNR